MSQRSYLRMFLKNEYISKDRLRIIDSPSNLFFALVNLVSIF